MSVVKKAVRDSAEVSRLAVDAAKNELVEALSPQIKSLISKKLREITLSEDTDRLRRAEDGHGETEFEESKDPATTVGRKAESIDSIFPGINEVNEMTGIDESEENYDDVSESSDEGDTSIDEAADDELDETLEINEAELEAMYSESLQLEAEVTKGFKDMEKPHEFGAGAKGQYQGDHSNLMDYKSGESDWDDVEVPAKQDWTVKEIRQLVKKGIKQNEALSLKNRKLTEMVVKLRDKLSEMNLLNAKIISVNHLVGSSRLTNEQKSVVINSIDKGTSIKEVRNIASAVKASLTSAGAISERRNPHANSQKRRTSGSGNPQVIRESVGSREASSNGATRWQQLAGLKKLVD